MVVKISGEKKSYRSQFLKPVYKAYRRSHLCDSTAFLIDLVITSTSRSHANIGDNDTL